MSNSDAPVAGCPAPSNFAQKSAPTKLTDHGAWSTAAPTTPMTSDPTNQPVARQGVAVTRPARPNSSATDATTTSATGANVEAIATSSNIDANNWARRLPAERTEVSRTVSRSSRKRPATRRAKSMIQGSSAHNTIASRRPSRAAITPTGIATYTIAPNIRTRESPIAPHKRHAPTAATKKAPTMIAVNSPAQLPRNNAPSGAIAPRNVGADPVAPNQFGDHPTRYARAASSGDMSGSTSEMV